MSTQWGRIAPKFSKLRYPKTPNIEETYFTHVNGKLFRFSILFRSLLSKVSAKETPLVYLPKVKLKQRKIDCLHFVIFSVFCNEFVIIAHLQEFCFIKLYEAF